MDAAQAVDDARRRLARDGAAAAYEQLLAADAPDPQGLVALECARLALALRQPALALGHLERARVAAPQSAQVLFELGRALNNLRRPDDAAMAFADALRLRPRWLDAQLNLAHVQRAAGRFADAARSYDEALALDAHSARGHAGAATVRLELREYAAAEVHFARACELDPALPGVWLQRGQALQSAGRPEAAVKVLREAARRAADDAVVHSALGSAHQSCGDLDAARACFETALALQPGLPGAAAALAGVLDLGGDGDAALALLAPLLDQGEVDPVVLLAYANLKACLRVDDALLRRLQAAVARADVAPVVRALLTFRLGDALDQRDDYAGAFAHYARANALRAMPFSEADLQRHGARQIARIRAGGDVRFSAGLRPVFIVGLPRSGTSLVEQILSRHSAIAVAGEQRALAAAAWHELGPWLRDEQPAIEPQQLAAVARRYRAALTAFSGTRGICTDKMWQNFEWLWLIRRAFPDAAIIHCARHPMAVGLSCFQRGFGAAPPPFSTRLTDIAAYIAHHERVFAAWREVGSPATLTLRYEDVVGDIEGQVRRLLDFLGLPYEPNCVSFHRATRAVTTESFAQVGQPLYARSVERWRCYERQLAPLRDALVARGVRLPS
jgi:tetratricopeptide (TPR) repeat protein